jgi:UDP-N-acetylglucosamine 2-epimerase
MKISKPQLPSNFTNMEVERNIKLDIIAGARPNFMKIAPIIHAIQNYNKSKVLEVFYRLIHTGQHYDKDSIRQRLPIEYFNELEKTIIILRYAIKKILPEKF